MQTSQSNHVYIYSKDVVVFSLCIIYNICVTCTSWRWQHKIAETCKGYLYIWTSAVSWKWSYLYWYAIKFKYSVVHCILRYTQQTACKAETKTVSDSCCAWCCVRNPTRRYMMVCCRLCVICVTLLAFIMPNHTNRSVLCSVQHNYWTAIVNRKLTINYNTALLIHWVTLSVKIVACHHCWCNCSRECYLQWHSRTLHTLGSQ